MSDIDVLRELAVQLRPPEYDDLVAVARKRRRRSALGVTAAVVVVVLGLGMAGAALSGGQRADAPAQNPSPSQVQEWTPERIRAEGSPGDPQGAIPTTDSGLATRLYEVCDGSRCDPTDRPPEDMHVALEVIQDGRSAVFDLHWSQQPWVKAFDEDSVLVQDAEWSGRPVRYRLLQADGTAVQLRLLDDPAPAVPRPDVVVIDRSSIFAGTEVLYLIDDRAGTVQPLEAPEDVRYWGPNVDEFLWGVTDDCRVLWATAGTFEERRLDCSDGWDFTSLDADWFPDGWLRPGRMAVAEQSGNRMLVHASLDRGVTWQRIPVKDQNAVPGVLRRLG